MEAFDEMAVQPSMLARDDVEVPHSDAIFRRVIARHIQNSSKHRECHSARTRHYAGNVSVPKQRDVNLSDARRPPRELEGLDAAPRAIDLPQI